MTPKQQAYEVTASTIIKNLAKRRMEGFYCPDSRSAVAKALELMPKGCSIAWGGSATVQQTGLMEAIRGVSYQIIDRDEAKTPEEKRVMFSRIVMADYFLMSANAITLDGQLMNIDGNGNRVGPLCYGPEHVRLCLTVFRRGFPPYGDGFVERGTWPHPDSLRTQKRVSVRPGDGGADRDGSGKFFQNFPEAGEAFRRNETARDADDGRSPASGADLLKGQELFSQDAG